MLLSPPLTRNWADPPPDTFSGEVGTLAPEPDPPPSVPCPAGFAGGLPPFSPVSSPELRGLVSVLPPVEDEPVLESEPPQAVRAAMLSTTASNAASAHVPRLLTRRLYCPPGLLPIMAVSRGDAGVQKQRSGPPCSTVLGWQPVDARRS